MATCPYCKEQIADGALKCRHCQSSLVGRELPETTGSGQVTYVLDKGLIYYGKFVLGALVVLVVLGVYGFGFELKDTVKQMADAAEKIRNSEEEVRSTELKIGQLQLDMQKIEIEIDQKRENMKLAEADLKKELDNIKKINADASLSASEASRMISELSDFILESKHKIEINISTFNPQLSSDQVKNLLKIKEGETSLVRTTAENPKSVTVKLWRPGATIRVKFLGGSMDIRREIEKVASEWLIDTGVSFKFGSDEPDSEIRIGFDSPGNWSYVGTDALVIPTTQATMNLTSAEEFWRSGNKIYFRKVVLTEFGHALGLVNEMMNPNANITWNLDGVKKKYPEWSESMIKQNFLQKYEVSDYRAFDPRSVMMGQIPKEFVISTDPTFMGYDGGDTLSDSDREFIKRLYPKQ